MAEFRLFGPMEVIDQGGRTVELGTRMQRAVHAMLALEPGRVVSLDRLIHELWAGEAPSSATGTLQAYISHLRKALEPDRAPRTPPKLLLTRDPGYVLAVAPGDVDLVRFGALAADGHREVIDKDYSRALRNLDEAIDLWRGDPLAEFADQGFAAPVIARLTGQRLTAEEDRFEARLALEETGSCVPGLERLAEQHPYRERIWGLLVLALYRSGRQADALAALRRARGLLAAELGIDPGPELRRLERAVLDQDPELTVPATPATPRPRTPVASIGANPLIGRADHLARITARVAESRKGHGGVLLFAGEPGIGKTRLAQAAADEALAREMGVAWGRCVDTATAPAFWPWARLLQRIAPDVAELLTGDPADREGLELFELYQRVLTALTAAGPLVAVLEDLHWADVASLRMLAFLAGELTRRPVLLVGTLRPEPGLHPGQLRDTLGALARECRTERRRVEPFGLDDVAAYLRARGVDQELAGVLHERSGGNPFYLGELLRLLDSEHNLATALPSGVREVIGRRISRLPADGQAVLQIAAVAGNSVDPDLLEAVTGTPVEQIISLLEPAVATGLLAEARPGYAFAHALVRDTLLAGLGRLERARLHLRIGERLEALPTSHAADLAYHFGRATTAGGRDKAVHYASAAARSARAHFAHDEAVELWELALASLAPDDIAGRCRILTELAGARRALGDADLARADVEQAVELAIKTNDRDALVAAMSVSGGQSVWIWRPYGTVDQRTVAILEDLLAGPLTDRHRATLLGTLGVELVYGPRRREGELFALAAVELARRLGDPVLTATTLNDYYLAAWAPGRERERCGAVGEMLALPALPRATELIARVLRMACSLRAGDLAGWDRDFARCECLLEEIGRSEMEGMVRVAETARRTLDADWAAAESLAARFHSVKYGASLWGPHFPRLIAMFGSLRGQGRVAEILDELVTRADHPLRPIAVLAALDCDDPGLARDLIARWGTEVRDDWPADFLYVVWGFVAARLGVPDPRQLYDRLAPTADRLMTCGMGMTAWGSQHVVLAELAHRLGDVPLALSHARKSLETHRRLGLEYWEDVSDKQLQRLRTARVGGR